MAIPSKMLKALGVLAVVAVLAGVYLYAHRGEETTDDAAFDAHIITLSPKTSGYIKVLNCADNQMVKMGDVLMEIDPADYIIKRDRMRATLEAMQAALNASTHTLETTQVSAPSNEDAASAQVEAATANWVKAAADLKRMKALSDEARSREQLDQAVAVERTTRSNMMDTKAKLRSAQTAPKTIAAAQYNVDQLAAQVKQAEADLAQAEKDLADTKITAPIDGRVTRKAVEVGNYVQVGQQLGSLVSNDVWVVANYKETQLQHIRPGQRVTLHVDAFPDHDFEGKIDSIQSGTGARFSVFPPENATGNFVKIVQRVPVKILLTETPDTKLPLGPGLSIVSTVYTDK